MEETKQLNIWLDGEIVKYSDSNISILTHSMQYGSGIFDGIRAYDTEKGAAIFRLKDHVKRFFESAKIYNMKLNYSEDEISKAIKDVVLSNNLKSCYIRPFAFYNDSNIGLSVYGKKTGVFIAAVPFGNYFKDKDIGIRCKVSSWRRISRESLPLKAKASGNYANSVIASIEAKNCGFDEAILLSTDGYVAEGPGENIFLVKENKLMTPDESSDILIGITRNSIIKIAKNMGFEVEQRHIRRDELYTAEEIFFTGTAAEITPILDVDGVRISNKIGQITKTLSEKYSDIVHGKDKEYLHWLVSVET